MYSKNAIKELTKKQLDILQYIHAGISNKDIADIMEVSISTVENHAKQIRTKLGAINRVSMAVMYQRYLCGVEKRQEIIEKNTDNRYY